MSKGNTRREEELSATFISSGYPLITRPHPLVFTYPAFAFSVLVLFLAAGASTPLGFGLPSLSGLSIFSC
jgi:hypothetical protein